MAQYIDKSALVAEIERRKAYYENLQMIKPVYDNIIEDYDELEDFIDTLEVREVDLDSNALEDNVVINTDWEGDWVLKKAQKGE